MDRVGKHSIGFSVTGKKTHAWNGLLLITCSFILEQESRTVSDMNLKDKSRSEDTKQ